MLMDVVLGKSPDPRLNLSRIQFCIWLISPHLSIFQAMASSFFSEKEQISQHETRIEPHAILEKSPVSGLGMAPKML